MNNMQNVVEYYDELYPSDESQRKFFMDLLTTYLAPSKFLRIGCGTGNNLNLSHLLEDSIMTPIKLVNINDGYDCFKNCYLGDINE